MPPGGDAGKQKVHTWLTSSMWSSSAWSSSRPSCSSGPSVFGRRSKSRPRPADAKPLQGAQLPRAARLLVYFDPWLAGVLLPTFIVVGLMAIPYVDKNPKSNGYYTFESRFSVTFYWVGFLLFWIIHHRDVPEGPNWSFFGPFSIGTCTSWPEMNVDVSTYFWVKLLDMPRPANIFLRESPGLALLGVWFFIIPKVLERPIMASMTAIVQTSCATT